MSVALTIVIQTILSDSHSEHLVLPGEPLKLWSVPVDVAEVPSVAPRPPLRAPSQPVAIVYELIPGTSISPEVTSLHSSGDHKHNDEAEAGAAEHEPAVEEAASVVEAEEEDPSQQDLSGQDEEADDGLADDEPAAGGTANEKPEDDDPAADGTEDDEPAANGPADDKPATSLPADSEPTTSGLAGVEPTAGGPADNGPAADEATPDAPAADTTADETASDRPVGDEPAAERPAAERPAAERPAANWPASDVAEDEPAAVRPTENEPAEERPAAERPAADWTAEERPAADAAEDESAAVRPIEDEPAAERPAADWPAAERPVANVAEDEPAPERLTDDGESIETEHGEQQNAPPLLPPPPPPPPPQPQVGQRPPSKQRDFSGHILCYGDGLTSGAIEEGHRKVPYAQFLEEALTGEKPQSQSLFGNIVDYLGLPGWTAVQMVQAQNHERFGLGPTIERDTNDVIDVAVILAGTADLFEDSKNSTRIAEAIKSLHRIALESGKVKRTIAIDIPPSGYQRMHQGASHVARRVNERLEEFARETPNVKHMIFPVPYVGGGRDWAEDNVHLSSVGYKRLGKAIAPVVLRMLRDDDDKRH